MTESQVQYVRSTCDAARLDRYIPRRFTTASQNGEVPLEEFRFRGLFREREPELAEILTHPQLLVLAEPGGGKSVIARAAVHEIARAGRVPISVELKEYRGDLPHLFRSSAPDDVLQDRLLERTYILDGIDEVPTEFLSGFAQDLEKLIDSDTAARVIATARQAFYVAHRSLFPKVSAVFHILDFSDEDIRRYVTLSGVDFDRFIEAADRVDLQEELGNPFILWVLVERFKAIGELSDRRSEMMSSMIDRLIQSRPRINAHRQRRALCMLAVALEVYSRNELTEEEALRVIRACMRISETEAHELLDELYGSILKRTGNGLAFQMRSYGEYLAAEELERESVDRVRELAFLDRNTPNESWLNAISYLAELNPAVRELFVRKFPFWMIQSSPSVFSEEERTAVASGILDEFRSQRQYLRIDSRIRIRYLARFITPAVEVGLRRDLASEDEVLCGNALCLLGVLKRPETVPLALDILKDQTRGPAIRQCAVIAVVNAGTAVHVPELLAALTDDDPIRINVVDAVGALADAAQLQEVLPLILRTDAGLSSTYYHFRELRSREALVAVLRYFGCQPQEFDSIRAAGYVEPVLAQLPDHFDEDVIELCVEIFQALAEHQIYPHSNGPLQVMLGELRQADPRGEVARRFFERQLRQAGPCRLMYYTSQLLASVTTMETARWLVEAGATEFIKGLAPFVGGQVREALRPYSGGVIDAQDENARRYATEQQAAEQQKRTRIEFLRQRLVQRTTLADTLNDLQELKDEHWPELPQDFKTWLATEIGALMASLNLEQSIRWDANTLWEPQVLPLLLRVVTRYELRLVPDELMIFPATGMDEQVASRYYQLFGFSQTVGRTLERLLANPPSPRALESLVRFVRVSGFRSDAAVATLRAVAANAAERTTVRADALQVLTAEDEANGFFAALVNDADPAIARQAFETLIDRQDRPTIERELAGLLNDEQRLRAGEVKFTDDSPLSWVGKIRSGFAWQKLAALRERALRLELHQVVSLLTWCLAQIDRPATATLIRQQLQAAPLAWRHYWQAQAIEQERIARIEQAQRSPFDTVLHMIRRSTSADKLLVVCEGPTDQPVFQALLAQVPDVPEVLIDFVGGWPALANKDPHAFLRGAKDAIVVMDGDNGRKLNKKDRPLTTIARQQERRLKAAGVQLRVLQRYGIENYFPRAALEAVLNKDLASYFPIPPEESVADRLSEGATSHWYRFRKFAALRLGLPSPKPTRSFYSKDRNGEVVKHISLDRDLSGTDLHAIIQEIAAKAHNILRE
jgi:hypothetical protein